LECEAIVTRLGGSSISGGVSWKPLYIVEPKEGMNITKMHISAWIALRALVVLGSHADILSLDSSSATVRTGPVSTLGALKAVRCESSTVSMRV
jgi:hypothetical protein